MVSNYTIIPAASIIFPKDRQRESVPQQHIDDLAKSIGTDCLIHAPTVTDSLELVAGGCRTRAILQLAQPYEYGGEQIPAGHCPVIVVTGKSEEQLFRIELEENLRRKQLTPVEESRAISKLHRMLTATATGAGKSWTKSETAAALSDVRGQPVSPSGPTPAQQSEVADNLLIESFADDPDVKRAKTRSEAVKLAKKKLEASFTQALGSSMALLRRDDFQLMEGSCLDLLQSLADETFAGIVTDPPYGIDADAFGQQSYHGGHAYEDGRGSALAIARHILSQGFRVCKPSAHLYMFCDIRLWPDLYQVAKDEGWQPYATPLIWYKANAGHAPQPGFFTRRYEALLFARKGDRTLTSSSSDVLPFASVAAKVHAAEKPVDLLTHLLKLSFFPGETILDPCVGSGSIFAAAKAAGMKAVGIELEPETINIARKRIGEL